MFRFCNLGHCFDFKPFDKITPYTKQPPVTNLQFYRDKVKHANNPAIYILDNTGKTLEA